MKKIKGNDNTPLIELINNINDVWVVRIKEGINEDGSVDFIQKEFNGQPPLIDIKEFIFENLNSKCDEAILNGLLYNNKSVWLSNENQQNYMRDLNLAVITGGGNLPLVYKLSDEYVTISNINDLQSFNIIISNHINNTLLSYWYLKDNFDFNKYKI